MFLGRFESLRMIRKIFISILLAIFSTGASLVVKYELASSAAFASDSSIASRINQLKISNNNRWIEVRLDEQQILAWEGDRLVYTAPISSGLESTPTREGAFEIQSMHIVSRMRGNGYDVPDVPYTMYYSGDYALHGAYWHQNFGTPMSHGCINLPLDAADWLFSWAHVGTPVLVH